MEAEEEFRRWRERGNGSNGLKRKAVHLEVEFVHATERRGAAIPYAPLWRTSPSWYPRTSLHGGVLAIDESRVLVGSSLLNFTRQRFKVFH